MFGKKETERQDTFETSNTNLRNSNQTQIRTLISEGCKFEGNLYSPAYTRIDGIVRGNLTGESGLIIGDKGTIDGDITSIEVTIYGSVKGNVKAHKLEVKKGGKIYGDIIVDHLLMEHGAVFIGHCKMNEGNSGSTEVFDLPDEEKPE
jgi:cytoskeletal protein CcmA (bactofilin family)